MLHDSASARRSERVPCVPKQRGVKPTSAKRWYVCVQRNVVLLVITPSCRAAQATAGLKQEPGVKMPVKAWFTRGWFSFVKTWFL